MAAVAVSDIKSSFPEFDLGSGNTAQNALIAIKLAEAQAQVDYSLFQNSANADSCVKYLTARLLALSPAAMNMKLSSADGSTIYDAEYKRLARAASFGFRVP